jgi:hypothetical protein
VCVCLCLSACVYACVRMCGVIRLLWRNDVAAWQTFTGYVNGEEHYFTHVRDPDRVSFTNFSSGFDFYVADAASPMGTQSIDWVSE